MLKHPATPEEATALVRGQLPQWHSWIAPVFIALLLSVISFYNFLLFHTLAEFFAVNIGIMMCVMAWQTYPFSRNNFLAFLACGYFWIAMLDTVHGLVYKGMNIFPDFTGGNPSTQFWLAARYSEALLLLAAPLFLKRHVNMAITFTSFGIVAVFLTSAIGIGYFPDGFIEGQGLTPFKIYSEYVIISILVLAMAHIWRRRSLIGRNTLVLLLSSIALTMGAELAFTFYVDVYGLSNIVGHLFKFFSFWLIFLAIIRTNLVKPYADLKNEAIERQRAEEGEEFLRGQLTHASRLSAVGDMATGLAHEINQPLTAIANYAEVCIRFLRSGKGDTEEIIADLVRIEEQTARAGEIIKWLRNAIRQEDTGKEPLQINACITEVRDLMGSDLNKRRATLNLELGDGLPMIMANKVQIQQVLVNLLQNSLMASERSEQKSHQITVRSMAGDDGGIHFCVEDNGPGIAEDIRDNIFRPFVSTRREGLGFGLSISRTIVEAHGGQIWLDSEIKDGATFHINLPAADRMD